MRENTQTFSFESRIENLVEDQRTYFNTNATKSVKFRVDQLRKLKSLLLKYEDEMHQAIYRDFGKSRFENQLVEIFPLYSEIDFMIRRLKKWSQLKRVRTNLLNFPARSYLIAEPLGVSLIIGAWNFPYNLMFFPLVGAISAGNTAVLKPSELAAETSRVITKIINNHFDPNYLRVVEGSVPETTAILNQRFDKIFFTGSPRVGKIVSMAAARHLSNVTLELGGKNPAIFTESCALKMSVKRMVWAKFANAGQFCITVDYALVHKDIKEEFLQLAVKEIEKSNFSFENNNYVKIINTKNFDRLVKLIDPSKIFYGGTYNKQERLIEPTILQGVTKDDAIMKEEIFGPILPVVEYESFDEALDIIKSYEKPLSAYLFTEDKSTKSRFLNEVSCGNGAINECIMQISNPYLPFGGVGNSGMGRYHGKYSFDCFSHYKAILEKPSWLETNLKYYGYTEKKLKIIKHLT